jgi:hypothetical protein
VKIVKFAEQNGSCTEEREFSFNEAHMHYWHKQKKALYKVKCNVRAFWGLQTGKFLSLKKNFLNTVRKYGTTATLYLTKC